ncbi:CoA transferase [Mycolicibacterium litorale]|uniref:CoA transferase n=1 Tax=Mycolicibacterium litorale TaxID=758802 RepID=UPI003CE961EC
MSNVSTAPLAGLRIVEVSSFVATPLCGLTLSELGAEVIRVDPLGGAADYQRWPVAETGRSIYWTGLNKGKRSVACDLRSEEGQLLVQNLVAASGERGGILVTNSTGRPWLSHDALAAIRPDVITVEVLGNRDGSAAVDYTVNAGLGFPAVTGSGGSSVVHNHVLPAWDVACGLYAALAVTAAVRRRERTGSGARVTLPLDDVALAVSSTLGYLTEVQINGSQRERDGNYLYGTFGSDFLTRDGERVMIVALTARHFRDLVAVTGTSEVIDAVQEALRADFSTESDRFRHRQLLTALFTPWFAERSMAEVLDLLAGTSVLHRRYRTFTEVAGSADVHDNPLFSPLAQPDVGTFLAAGHPACFDGEHFRSGPASSVGADTDEVVRQLLLNPSAD